MIAVTDNSFVGRLSRSKRPASGIYQLVNVRRRQLSIFPSWLGVGVAGTILGMFGNPVYTFSLVLNFISGMLLTTPGAHAVEI